MSDFSIYNYHISGERSVLKSFGFQTVSRRPNVFRQSFQIPNKDIDLVVFVDISRRTIEVFTRNRDSGVQMKARSDVKISVQADINDIIEVGELLNSVIKPEYERLMEDESSE